MVRPTISMPTVCREVAGALKAEKLLMLTDVRGIYEDHHDESTFLSTLTFEKAHELIIKGSIDGGMIPKVKACITGPFRRGTQDAHHRWAPGTLHPSGNLLR